jgi:hypothetical protein
MRHEPTTDELPIAKTVELPDGRKTVEIPGAATQPGKTADSREDNAESRTTELPTSQRGHHRPEAIQARQTSPAPKSGFWRELTGALTAGTILLAIAVLVLQTIAWLNGMPGLGAVVLIGHLVGAALAVAAQRVADRRSGKPALAAGLGIGAVVVLILVLFWWI